MSGSSLITIISLYLIVNLFGKALAVNCTIGNQATVETNDGNNPGLYLDIDHPAVCSGQIIAWHFCHYTPWLSSSSTYSAVFQVWRETSSNNYTKVFEVSRNVVIPRRQSQFLCQDVDLEGSEYISINQGDVLGMYIPMTKGLRTIAVNHIGNRLHHVAAADAGQLTQVNLSSTQEMLSQALHLTADIVIPPPTEPPTTESSEPAEPTGSSSSLPTIAPTLTNSSGNNTQGRPVDPGLAGGAVAAVVILLIIIGAAVTIIILVVVGRYMKKCTFSMNKNDRSKSEYSTDNVVYDDTLVRSNSVLAHYLNKTNGGITDYEIPVSLKYHPASRLSVQLEGRQLPPESMYIQIEGREGVNTTDQRSEFTDSFETDSGSEPDNCSYGVQKRQKSKKVKTDSVFDIYRSLAPGDQVYCQFMEETVSQTASLPSGLVGSFDPYADPPTDEQEIYKDLSIRSRVILSNEIKIMDGIGAGEFAFVKKAMWQDKTGAELAVAVKTLHSSATQEDKIKLLREAAIMGQFVHPNVVRLIGVIKDNGMTSLVTEFCAKGDLCQVLGDMRPGPGQLISAGIPNKLISYSQQIALAMHYLSAKGFVHRDLAARNIFVTQDNICKVGDFGMSRDLADSEYYMSQGGTIPLRWTAPEAIYFRKYSTSSDIWSYGCLLFEIWSMGRKPFDGVGNTEVLKTIKTGYRLPPPPGCPLDMYRIMIQCWDPDTGGRPQFRDILTSMLKDDSEIIQIPVEDASTHPQAFQLGAPLEAGKGMYLSLQYSYLREKPVNNHDTIYEAIDQYSSLTDSVEMNRPSLTSQRSYPMPPPPLPSAPIPSSSSSKQPLLLALSTASQSAELIYDDIDGFSSSTTPLENGANTTREDDLHENIVNYSQSNHIPEANNYEVPADAQMRDYDVDYEDI